MRIKKSFCQWALAGTVLVICLACGGTANATLLFSTINQPNDATNHLQFTTERLASDFISGASATTIQSTTLEIFNNDNNFTAHHLTASIFTDNSGVPGTLVGSFNPFTANAFQGFSNGFATSPTGINLAANTIYWEVLQLNETANNPFVGWERTQSQVASAGTFNTVSSTQVKFSSNSGSTWSDLYVGNSIFQLDGVTTVPEPSAFLLGTMALAGGTWLRRRV